MRTVLNCLSILVAFVGLSFASISAGDFESRRSEKELEIFLGSIRKRLAGLSSEQACSQIVKDVDLSKWRNSTPAVVRALVSSSMQEERILGWKFARLLQTPVGWSMDDVEKVLSRPNYNEHVSMIYSIASTDPVLLGGCLTEVLESPTEHTLSKVAAIDCLKFVQSVPVRVELWHVAIKDPELRESCIASYSSVASDDTALLTMFSLLGERSSAQFAISSDFYFSTEVRILTCRALGRYSTHQDRVVTELQKWHADAPAEEDLDFQAEVLRAISFLRPESKIVTERTINWLRTLPLARSRVLHVVPARSNLADAIEPVILSEVGAWSAEDKCSACQWLSGRISSAAAQKTKALMDDEHPGVQLAACVSLGVQQPMCELNPKRERLLALMETEPERLALGFADLNEAVVALVLAGSSYADASELLGRYHAPLCREASKTLSLRKDTGSLRDVSWRGTLQLP